jgi:hypothetical protein
MIARIPEKRYRVVHSEIVKEPLRRWATRAIDLGLSQWFLDVLEFVEHSLTRHPHSWGDPVYDLHHLELVVFRATYEKFVIEYSIHEEHQVVFVKEFRLLSGNPLESGG